MAMGNGAPDPFTRLLARYCVAGGKTARDPRLGGVAGRRPVVQLRCTVSQSAEPRGESVGVATTDDPANPVIVEGVVVRVLERDSIAAFAEWCDTKYETSYGFEFFDRPENACFRLEVTTAFGISGVDFTGSPTKWVFARR